MVLRDIRDGPAPPEEEEEEEEEQAENSVADRVAGSPEGTVKGAVGATEVSSHPMEVPPPPPPPLTPKPKPKPKVCAICEKKEGIYKCPRCTVPYCSVACFRPHKDNHLPDEPKATPTPPKSTAQDVGDDEKVQKGKSHPFSILDDSPELAQLFKRYPNLPSRLANIHAATLPPPNEEPHRSGLPWTLQDAPGYQPKKTRWTHDTGLRRGKKALRQARTDPGEDGDAVREYCELVLHLLSKDEATVDVTNLIRHQATQEDVELIEKLTEVESKWD